AKLANPDKADVCVVGDGGIKMTNKEMAKLPEYGLDIKIVVINKGTLGRVKQWQEKLVNQRFSHSVFNGQTDFMKMAEAYGVKGFLNDKPEQL
ncbi:thiamine pyrophosphate-dependent enzyme, partial [Staphylococcus aureus]